MKGFIVYPTYRILNNKAHIYLFGKLENGESFLTITKFRPYFFIKRKDFQNALELAKFDYEETDFKNFSGDKMVKIILDIPSEVKPMREKFEFNKIRCYEADIRFVVRFLIDHEIKGTLNIEGKHKKGEWVDRIYENPRLTKAEDYQPKLKTLSIDIETKMDASKIFCISLYTEDYEKVLIVSDKAKHKKAVNFENEKALLLGFLEEIKKIDPDIITGWNVIDFDFAVIRDRLRAFRIPFKIGRADWDCRLTLQSSFFVDSRLEVPGRMVLDGINMLKGSFVKLLDYKLNTAAKHFLGEEKLLQGDNKYEEIQELYQNNQNKLIDYNLLDSKLAYDILQKSKTLALTIQRSMLTGMSLDRVNASVASLDFVYLVETKKKGLVSESRSYNNREERIKGGFVRESRPGIYNYIIVLDFKSLYPSIIRTFNIDPFSFIPKGQDFEGEYVEAPNGARFRNEEGILPEIIEHLWKQRDAAKKEKNMLASHAIKILMNSFFGVLANPTCRFYSLEIANAITHFGQYLIKMTAEKIEELGYNVIYGDSITKERYVTLLIDGKLYIKNIHELFNQNKKLISKINGKERINLSNKNILALTLNKKTLKPEFSQVNELIRHKTNKKIYRVNQKYGETICTEDHSIMAIEDKKLKEIKPTEISNKHIAKINKAPDLEKIKKIDLYEEFKHYSYSTVYKGRKKISCFKKDDDFVWFGWTNRKKQIKIKRIIEINSPEFEALCRLLGAYIAEGSSSTRETTKRKGASISEGDLFWLMQLKKDFMKLFRNSKAPIVRSCEKRRTLNYSTINEKKQTIYDDCTFKLQMMSETAALFFKLFCGQTSKKKKLPNFIFHVPKKYQKIILDNMIIGDGSRETNKKYSKVYRLKHFRYYSSSLHLISGLSFLLAQLNIAYSIQYDSRKKSYRLITSDKNNVNLNTKLTKEEYSDYVYDLAIEDNNMFVDSCGQILLHNTDSIFVESQAETYEEAQKIGEKIQDFVNDFYGSFVKGEYKRENFMELEFEKTYTKFMMPTIRGSTAGAKKRYAGILIKDGKEKMDFVGLEFVRRDWTDAAKLFQKELLDRIFKEEEGVKEFIKQFVKDIKNGKYDDLLVYRKALRKELDEYTKTTPPHVKAARQLDKVEGSLISYYMTIDGPQPVQKLRSSIDYDHYIEKQIKPIADSILGFYKMTFDELLLGSSQKNLFDY